MAPNSPQRNTKATVNSEELSVENGGARFVNPCFRDPQALEGAHSPESESECLSVSVSGSLACDSISVSLSVAVFGLRVCVCVSGSVRVRLFYQCL